MVSFLAVVLFLFSGEGEACDVVLVCDISGALRELREVRVEKVSCRTSLYAKIAVSYVVV